MKINQNCFIKLSKYNMQLMLKYMNIKFWNELIFLYDGWKLFFPKKKPCDHYVLSFFILCKIVYDSAFVDFDGYM